MKDSVLFKTLSYKTSLLRMCNSPWSEADKQAEQKLLSEARKELSRFSFDPLTLSTRWKNKSCLLGRGIQLSDIISTSSEHNRKSHSCKLHKRAALPFPEANDRSDMTGPRKLRQIRDFYRDTDSGSLHMPAPLFIEPLVRKPIHESVSLQKWDKREGWGSGTCTAGLTLIISLCDTI